MGAAGSIPNAECANDMDLDFTNHREMRKKKAAPEWLSNMRAQSRLRTPSERFLSFTSDDPMNRLVHCWCCFEMTDRKNAFSDTNPTSGVTRFFCSRNCYKTSCSETAIAIKLENAETKRMDKVSSNVDARSYDEEDLSLPPGLVSMNSVSNLVADQYEDAEFDCRVARVNSK